MIGDCSLARAQVVDFQWHPGDPFTMVSVSDGGDGGTLQVLQ